MDSVVTWRALSRLELNWSLRTKRSPTPVVGLIWVRKSGGGGEIDSEVVVM